VQLDADLRRIGLEEQLTMQYQPILDISSGELVGFEALVRWRHPTRGLLTPSQFIARAVELGVIADIDHFTRAPRGRSCEGSSN
jgi:EAL domain-containing protein (putative c-di-GMP-specific phosphodiesterase class I)